MRILSKYKDYYDYLSGVYGVDPKLVLDRRDFEFNPYRFKSLDEPSKPDFITLFIAGYRIEGVYQYFKFYYGDELKKLCKEQTYTKQNRKRWWYRWVYDYPKEYYSHFKHSNYDQYILHEIVEDKLEINKKYNCPILLRSNIGSRTDNIQVEKWPILGNMGIPSYIQAEEIYQWLTDWLSQRENDKEVQRGITINNIDKIKSKGFDTKSSFRNLNGRIKNKKM